MNYQFESIKSLIESSDSVEFGNFGEGVSDFWIDKAEKHIGFLFPEQYKWWLRNFGGGEIEGEEIYSIYEMDFEEVSGGDIVNMSNINTLNNILPLGKVAICEPPNTGEIFYFDLFLPESDTVYLLNKITSLNEKYADDFLQFLEKRIHYYN
ncbi:MAG: SMI1/KNR4 family protein [Porticoccaceae bacterium]